MVYGDWSIWSREITEGDHVITVGPAKILYIMLNKISVCTTKSRYILDNTRISNWELF
jgi:hypothetical protein